MGLLTVCDFQLFPKLKGPLGAVNVETRDKLIEGAAKIHAKIGVLEYLEKLVNRAEKRVAIVGVYVEKL